MEISPMGPTGLPPAASGPGGAQGLGGPGSSQGAQSDGPAGVDFAHKLNGPESVQGPGAVAEPVAIEFKDGTNPLDQIQGIRDEMTQIRGEYEKQVASGEIDASDGQLQMWRLLDLQTRAQDVAFRVELVTKVIEQGAGSIKQLSQTQA